MKYFSVGIKTIVGSVSTICWLLTGVIAFLFSDQKVNNFKGRPIRHHGVADGRQSVIIKYARYDIRVHQVRSINAFHGLNSIDFIRFSI